MKYIIFTLAVATNAGLPQVAQAKGAKPPKSETPTDQSVIKRFENRCLTDLSLEEKHQRQDVEDTISHIIRHHRDHQASLLRSELIMLRTVVTGEAQSWSEFALPYAFLDGFFRPERGFELAVPFKVRNSDNVANSMGLGFQFTSKNLVYACFDYMGNGEDRKNRIELVFLSSPFLKRWGEEWNPLTLTSRLFHDASTWITRNPQKPLAEVDSENIGFRVFEKLPGKIFGDFILLDKLSALLTDNLVAPSEEVLWGVISLLVDAGVYRVTIKEDEVTLYTRIRVLKIPVASIRKSIDVDMDWLKRPTQ